MNKTIAVLNHLKESGSITSIQAINLYAATRLSHIIYKLRNRGFNIDTIYMEATDKYGNPMRYAKYVLRSDRDG